MGVQCKGEWFGFIIGMERARRSVSDVVSINIRMYASPHTSFDRSSSGACGEGCCEAGGAASELAMRERGDVLLRMMVG